jgi:hypothetical protein
VLARIGEVARDRDFPRLAPQGFLVDLDLKLEKHLVRLL